MDKIKKLNCIGVVVKPTSPLAVQAINRVLRWGESNDVVICLDPPSATAVGKIGFERIELLKKCDLLLVLGGDGTFLSASRAATDFSVPLIGVNLGSLGFITEVHLEGMETALDRIIRGEYEIENRMMIDVKIEGAGHTISEVALNDVVLTHKNIAKIIELGITINKQKVTHYMADGLIISSPTGSTAYSLSAGGPILYPTINALAICPICPHTISNRPLVIPGDSVIEVDIHGQIEVIATMDGQVTIDVEKSDHVTISPSKKVTRIVKVPDRSHFDTLREKLGWGGMSRNHG